MKKVIFSLALFLTCSLLGYAQKGISYQAVILDPNPIEIPGQDITGQPFVNGAVSLKFKLFSSTFVQEFEEVHVTQTDAYGMVNVLIGSVSQGAFSSLVWDSKQKSLQVLVSFDQGGTYTKVSEQVLTYNPMALFAETASKLSETLSIAGGGTGATTAAAARTNLGLGNVDNTADVNKPISTATQSALATKANADEVNTALATKANAAEVNTALATKANAAEVNTALATKANASDVTTSLGLKEDVSNKANTPLGTSTSLYPTQNAVKTYVDAQIASATIPDADATSKGKIQLAGDLAGTAAAPTVPGLAAKANASDVTTSLALKEDVSNKSNTPLGTSTSLYPTQNAVKTYVDAQVAAATIPDANSITKGKIQLAGDLGGTAAAPTVPGLTLKLDANQKGVANGVASLNASGIIPSSQLPPVTVSSTTVVGSDAAMIALSNQTVGSIAVRTDVNKNYVLSALPASTLGNWIELLTPGAPVQTVNGYIGTVNLTKTDLGLSNVNNTSDLNKPISTATQSALDLKANGATVDAALATKLSTADATAALSLKANSADVTTALATKLSTADATAALALKANSTDVTNALATKLSTADATAALALKANSTDVTTALATKLSTADATAALALKANSADVTTTLATKISNADATAALALKLDANKVAAANGVASLDALGKVPTDQIPAISFSSVKVLGSEAEMLGLGSAVVGSVVIRTDESKNYVLAQPNPAVRANWIQLLTPAAPVQAVNGKTGTVSISATDLGLGNVENTTDANKPVSSATQTELDKKVDKVAGKNLSTNDYTTAEKDKLAAITGITNLATSVSGTLAVANGGTGATTLSGLVKGNGTSAFTAAVAGTDYQEPLTLTTTGSGVSTLSGTTLNIPTGVPYSGATGAVNLGAYDLTVNGLTVGKGVGNGTTNAESTALGQGALTNANTTGGNNTALGYRTLYSNTSGANNTVVGGIASYLNQSGSNNVAIGSAALYTNTTTSGNVAVGKSAGQYMVGGLNTTIGAYSDMATTTFTNATAIGYAARAQGSNMIQLGADGSVVNGIATTPITNVRTTGTLTLKDVTYPNAHNGIAGQILTTDASGVASWATPAASGIPYTGATGAVNLGAYDLTVNNLTIGRGKGGVENNTAIGLATLSANTTGAKNTAVGYASLAANTTGANNTATGYATLVANTTGANNTATGYATLVANTTGNNNTATGNVTLSANTTGANNTATGNGTLAANTTGGFNTASGSFSLGKNQTGNENTAMGYNSLYENLAGTKNTGVGAYSLLKNTGTGNTAVGYGALVYNVSGTNNVAQGLSALQDNTSGSDNTAVGNNSLLTNKTGNFNTAIGSNANVNADNLSNSIAIGYGARVYTSNTIQLGPDGNSFETNSITYPTTAITNVKTSGTLTLKDVTYPNTHRSTAGDVLTINSSGTASWAAPSGGVSGTVSVGNGGTGATTLTSGALLKGNGTSAISAATAGSDYSAGTSALGTGILKSTTSTGALTIATAADFPTLNQNTTGNAGNVTGTVAVANGGTGATTLTGYVKGTGTTAMTASASIPLSDVTGAAPIASPTFTGTLTAPIYASTPQALTDAATISWNPSSGLNASVTLAGNRTLSFSTAPPTGAYGTLVVKQDATGGKTLTLPSVANKILGSSSTTTIGLSTAANAIDIVNFYFDGTNYFWNVGQGYGTAATSSATNITGGAAGSIPYQTAAGATSLLAKGTDGQILTLASGLPSWAAAPATGVTSVAMSAPTGLTVSGSPITSSGTLALSMATGYAIPATTSQTNWDAAYTNRITSATSPLSISSNAISLGTVPIANGGTNSTATPTNGGVGYGTGSAHAYTSAGTSGQVLTSAGAGAPTWSTLAAVRMNSDEFTATAAQTVFTFTTTSSTTTVVQTPLSKPFMYINGIRIKNAAFTWTSGATATTVTYVPANNNSYTLVAGDRITFDYAY